MIGSLDVLMGDFFKQLKLNVDFNQFSTEAKQDGSPVTEVDMLIHHLFFSFCEEKNLGIPILSEESIGSKNMISEFPAFIIDPVDGTKDLIRGNGEWSVSIAYLNSSKIDDPMNKGWVYQPHLDNIYNNGRKSQSTKSSGLKILVSRTEYNDGLFDQIKQRSGVEIIPMGSIALKLAKLSAGECDAVITFRPKSIWDLAAGVVLSCRNHGFFCVGDRLETLTHFHTELTYNSPMLFGRESNKEELLRMLTLLKE